tara:strand:+ start:1905 stop:2138 length:234 start_codon:yes stop_codon:yes gene_type:complete
MEEVDMKFVMYREPDHNEMDRGYHCYIQGVIGISTIENEEKLVKQMEKRQEEEEFGYNGEVSRVEFEIDETGFIILE